MALYSGLYVRADAISASLRYKVQVLNTLAQAGAPLRFTVFTHGSQYDEPWVRSVSGAHDVATHWEFADADLHVFEFGIRYDLFDCVFLLPPGRRVVGVYHNVTPPELADSSDLRVVLEQSLVQKHNLFQVDRIACVSEYNRDDLLTFGIDAARLSVLHLPPAIVATGGQRSPGGVAELLFVGRFVTAKGVLDLVRAVGLLQSRSVDGFRLTLAGNRRLSAPACMAAVDRLVAEHCADGSVRVVSSPSDDELASLYEAADALVIPSYHEGYCLPVIEAMSAGCAVIAYDSANLPYVVNGLGTLVATGDVAALADAIGEFVEMCHRTSALGLPRQMPVDGDLVPEAEWRRAVARHTEQYSMEAYRQNFLELLTTTPSETPRLCALRDWLGENGVPS